MAVKTWLQKVRALTSKPVFRGAVGGLVIVSSLGYMVHTLIRNWSELVTYEWQIDCSQVALAFISYSASLILAILGWSQITGRLTQVTDRRKHLKYYVYARLIRRFPAPLLYLLGRMYLYKREGVDGSRIAVVSLLEWVVIVLSGTVVCLLILPFLPLPAFWRSPWIPLGILIFGTLLIHPRLVQVLLRLLGQKESPIHFGYGDVLAWIGVYSLVWIGGGLILYAVINSLSHLPLSHLPTVIGIWTLSGLAASLAFALSVGFGIKELTLVLLLEHLMPSSLAVVIALSVRLCTALFEVIWGVIALKL